MRQPRPRSGLEEGRLDLGSFTPGERYSAMLLLAFTVVLFAFGLPDGKPDAASGVGKIPSLASEAGLTPAARPAPAALSEPVLTTEAPIEPTTETVPPFGPDEGASPPSSPSPSPSPSSPPPTASPVPSVPALPVPVPVPAPAAPLRLEAPR